MLPIGVLSRPRKQRTREEFNGPALPTGWARTDTENKITFAGGQAVVAGGKAAPAFDDPRLTHTAKSWLPRAGLAFEAEITWTAFGATGCDFGFDKTNPVADGLQPGFQVFAGGVLRVIQAQGAVARQATAVTLALNVPYRFRVRLLDPAYGVQWSFSADQGKTWVVVFVDGQYPTLGTPLWMGFSNNDAAYKIEYMQAGYGRALSPALSDAFAARSGAGRADTGQPWLNSSGKTPPTIAGDLRITPGATEAWLIGWDGIADGVWEGDLNFGSAPSTQKAAFIVLRQRDSTNYVRVTFSRSGQQIAIVRVANNVATTVATLSSVGLADNTTYRMRVAAYGPVIVVYQDGAERLRGSEAFGQYFGLCSFYLNDNLATPDIRWDNVRAWGTPPPPLLADSFDRPDSVTDLGTADSGQTYIPFTDVANVPTWGIESGRVLFVSTGGPGSNDRMARTALARASYLCWALLRTRVAGSGLVGIMLRALDSQNWVALRLQFTGATNFLGIFKDVAGVRSSASNISQGVQFPADTDQLVAVAVTGNVFEYWNNGVRQTAATITDHATSPAGGPYLTSGSDPRIDDLRYVPLGTALMHDTFTRADSALTAGNTELPGTPWVPLFGGTWGINSNQLYNVDTASVRGLVVPVLATDVDEQCDLVRQASIVGLLARCDAVGGNYLLAQFDGTNLLVRERVASGTLTTLSTTPYAWTAGATARIVRVRVFQGMLSVYVNEVLIVAQPFAGHAGAAEIYYGPYNGSAGANTNRFDNFLVREVAA